MFYDPIKDRLGRVFSTHPVLQKCFYAMLNVVFLRAWYVRREVRRLMGALPADRTVRVLDAGTGFGQYAYFIASEFPNSDVLAVDIKTDYLDNGRRFIDRTAVGHRVRFAKADLTVLDLDSDFDLVLSVDVMEHIEDDRTVFRNFERVLKPGGYVVINTPSDQGGSDVRDSREQSFIQEHVRPGYSRTELTGKLQESGFEIVKCIYTYGRYGSRAWRLLVKWPMQMLSRTSMSIALLPVYYAAALPAGSLLNALDVQDNNETGTGLLVVARKPMS